MTVSKERVADKRPMDEGRTPDEGASSESGAAHEGMACESWTTSKPATTVKTAAAAKPRLRRRYYQCGAQYARRYDRDQIFVDHCTAPAVTSTALTGTNVL